jgi:hypothetical protein
MASASIVRGEVELGDVVEYSRQGDTFQFRTREGALVRLNVLRSDMFRIQAGPQGTLEGEGSKAAPIVLPADYVPVNARLEEQDTCRVIATSDFVLVVNSSPLRFALYRPDGRTPIWRELKPIHLDTADSYQTLESDAGERFFGGGQQNGAFEFKGRLLEISYSGGWEEGDRPSPAPFYMSSRGYGVLRNTWTDGSYDFRSTDYLTTTHRENRFDAYYLVGPSVHHVLDLYTMLTGRARLLPRWAFEFGDADCYNDGDNAKKPGTVPDGWSDGPTGTTPDVIETVAVKYRAYDMPGGWILPNDGYGCGYTDLPTVVEGLRKYGFSTGLWTENGVEKIAWEVGTAGTRVQKLDVAWTGQGYQFAMDANRDAAQGILDNSDSRPFLWTVMGWAGIQRYAVTWTGDQSGSWDYIRWHVPTLIGSGLSGQVYATGDVDGIYGGSPETYTRDLQWKCFTPVLMGMSGWSKAERKHPWWFDEPYRSINRKYLKLKMRLVPYMYTLAREAEQTGAPIVRGLMWDHPADPHAQSEDFKYQFFLGRDLLVAPVFRSQAASGGWRDGVYLPEGTWVDYWDGTVSRVESEGRKLDYPVTLEKLPLLVRAGAILPLYPQSLYDGQVPKDVLTLDVYPFGASEFTLYEDDGNTRAYQDGQYTLQTFRVDAPTVKPGNVEIDIEPVQGRFDGMYEERTFVLEVHSQTAPDAVALDRRPLMEIAGADALERAASGWYYDADDRRGVAHIKTGLLPVRTAHSVELAIASGAPLAPTAGYASKPPGDSSISPDQLLVINRPAEEPGHPLENAFDGNLATWFRTVRNQSVPYGPHEFVLSLGGRRAIDGFRIAPRNDQWWKYGQVRSYEIYVGDVNGMWGHPAVTGSLELSEGVQTVRFPPVVGRLLRFRVLSTYDMETDPMVKAASGGNGDSAYDASTPVKVNPTTISEFRLLEHQMPEGPARTIDLSDYEWSFAECSGGIPVKFPSASGSLDGAMQMNDLAFRRGLQVTGGSRIDFQLSGDWQTFRVDAGIDDRSDRDAVVRFQVHGDGRLLYDSGPVRAGAIAKPNLDIRGVTVLSLRTVEISGRATADWTNAAVTGYPGEPASR